MYAGEGNFPEARGDNALDLPQHSLQRQTDRHPSRRRNDAVGTRLGTSGLNAQGERCSSSHPGLNHRAATAVAIAESFGRRKVQLRTNATEQRKLDVVWDDPKNVRKRCDFIWPTCGIAAGHDDLGIWIYTRNATNGLSCRLIRARRNRARIDDDNIGFFRWRCRVAACEKVLLDSERIGLVHAAAERDHGVLHGSSAFSSKSFFPDITPV